MHSSPGTAGDTALPRFRDLGAPARRQAQIVVLHDGEPDGRGLLWALSLADVTGRPLGREHLHVLPGQDPSGHLGVDVHLDAVGMRVHGEWFTGADPARPRRYARVVPSTPRR
ncbi:hypothetical protein [Cellulomonas sp. C5510]|uniref:hypothetical protein n=1 Tax=Cellulomonas sp. C5510 TaxID=2871170 RepID=UPI001C943ECA|nr:hypothetical protein [Cellulomonas sp. C5510]QZN84199.1 hypothetical protein K5O09_09820 [Cellulomonas sp. C5510]